MLLVRLDDRIGLQRNLVQLVTSLPLSMVIQFSPGMVIENFPAVARLVMRYWMTHK